MTYYIGNLSYDADYLEHYGVQGQKKGIRRWQNPDGSLTPDGYIHYYGHTPEEREARKAEVLKTGTAEEVRLYQSELTAKEFNDVLNRLRNEKSLEDMIPKERTKAERIYDKLKKGSEYISTVATAIDNMKKLKKALFGEKEKEKQKKDSDANRSDEYKEMKGYMKDLAEKYLLSIQKQIKDNDKSNTPNVKQLSEFAGIMENLNKITNAL